MSKSIKTVYPTGQYRLVRNENGKRIEEYVTLNATQAKILLSKHFYQKLGFEEIEWMGGDKYF